MKKEKKDALIHFSRLLLSFPSFLAIFPFLCSSSALLSACWPAGAAVAGSIAFSDGSSGFWHAQHLFSMFLSASTHFTQ